MSSFTRSHSFVQRTFPPLIGALTTPLVEEICQKNNVSFTELLQPFCTVYADYQLKDPSGNDVFIKHLKVGVNNVEDVPPEPSVARRLMNEAVAGASCDVTKEVSVTNSCGTTVVDIPAECPWFHAWADTFFRVQFPSEHEFTRHLLGCMIVTSTSDDPETLQSLLENLKQMQVPKPSQVPKWFCPAIFKFYVVIHDYRNGGKQSAVAFFETIKTAYGADNCFFLELNSRQQGEGTVLDVWIENKPKDTSVMSPFESPVHQPSQQSNNLQTTDHPLSPLMDNHKSISGHGESFGSVKSHQLNRSCGSCLSAKDVDSLRELMCSVVRNALLPHVEKQIYILNDLVANKKGMSRSLLNATKRLFGSPRPGTVGTAGSVPPPVFALDAPELQLRRLADLYFIFSSYSNAFQTYYTAKRELGAEQAWLYYAGALEMAALSAFLLPDPVKKGIEYMEEAILTYLNACQLRQFATRATLLSVECLKEREMFNDAAKQLIRMTSEDSDLRSALLLEQAAYCVLNDSKPRKYAFHLVLAAHRYSKAGQRKHAIRCARQALQIYGGKSWLAEDHIHSTIGRLAGQLYQQGGPNADPQLLSEGLKALTQLLHSRSRQGASQQATYLLDYLTMHQAWQVLEETHKLAPLPLPEVEDNTACVRVVAADPSFSKVDAFQVDSQDETLHWSKMEEIGLTETLGAAMVFKPSLPVLNKSTLNPNGLVMAVNERLEVQIALRNPLQISLPLAQLRLLWTWTDIDGQTFDGGSNIADDSEEKFAVTEQLPSLLLPPLATHFVTLSVSPRLPGTIVIKSVACALTTAVAADSDQSPPIVRGRQDLVVRGPKLRPPKDRPFADYYADDKRLTATIISAAPNLTVSNLPTNISMLCGQMEEIELELRNAGNTALTYLHAVTDSNNLLTLPNQIVHKGKRTDDAEFRSQLQVMTIDLSSSGGVLEPGARLALRVWIRGPDLPGTKHLRLLIIYGCDGIKHRVVRVTLRLLVAQGIQMTAIATRSCHGDKEASNLCVTASNNHSASVTLRSLVLANSSWALQPHTLSIQDAIVMSSESSLFVCRARRHTSTNDRINSLSSVKLTNKDLALSQSANNLLLNRSTQCILLALVWETLVNEKVTLGLSLVEIGTMGAISNDIAPLIGPDLTDASSIPRSLVIFGSGKVNSANVVPDTTESPLFISLDHPERVLHSFINDRVCLVDVKVNLTSRSGDNLNVTLNGAGTDDLTVRSAILPSHVYTPHAASAFTWSARACAKLTIAPHGQATTTLRAALTKPGTYDLALRLTAVANDSKGRVLVSPLSESPLILIDSDSHVS